jgi:hypothetical protein
LTSYINSVLAEEFEDIPDVDTPPSAVVRQRERGTSLEGLAARISEKLEEGNFKGAIRLACSEDTVAVFTESNLEALQMKHPKRHSDSHIQPQLFRESLDFEVTAEMVRKSIYTIISQWFQWGGQMVSDRST